MILSEKLRLPLLGYAQRVMASRPPDQTIGGDYVHRWRLRPKGGWSALTGNIYIHRFYRSDEDSALHDHEPDNVSLVLDGEYKEHFHLYTLDGKRVIQEHWESDQGRYLTETVRRPQGSVIGRLAGTPHRIELIDNKPVTTMFVQGPRRRTWGFHCVGGWMPHYEFLKQDGDRGGKGCGDDTL